LIAGKHYLVDPNSGTAQGTFDVLEVNTSNYLHITKTISDAPKVIAFNFTNLSDRDSIIYFQRLAYKTTKKTPTIWVEKNKLMYSVGRYPMNYPMILINQKDYKTPKSIHLEVNNKYIPQYGNQNVIGYLPPKKGLFKSKKLIVLSAHFDHLGKMGQAMFPGANDNASGVAMLLSMAKYYKVNPIKYGVVFCFFSGEEAGLEGSKYFVQHPYFKLKKVKFVLNIDIMGGASESITAVNATQHIKHFNKLVEINNEKSYLPKVLKRGPTANSDHHFFAESGVPAFFIYAGGKVKNYHDIYDTAENTPLNNFDEVQNLIIDFIAEL
jgi:Iap family predicted aminopeptidase